MNNNRRDKIKAIIKQIERVTKMLDEVLTEEYDAYENMPEGLKCTDNGFNSENAQENIEQAIDTLNEAVEYLEEI